jgi:hypothetical protein
MFIVFIFLVTYTPIQIISSSNLPSPDFRIKYGSHAVNALQHLLNFFESDANNLNLDGLYGLRIAQGQLNALNQILTSSINQENYLTDKNNIIHSLSIQIERIANVSLNQIEREESEYLHRFSLVAYQPFVTKYQAKKIPKHLIENGERNSDFDEEESDKCFAELLGKFNKNNSIQSKSFFGFRFK